MVLELFGSSLYNYDMYKASKTLKFLLSRNSAHLINVKKHLPMPTRLLSSAKNELPPIVK